MAAIKIKRQAGVDHTGFNSGVLLTILKHLRVQSDVTQEVIQEWCKHVSQFLK